MIRADCRQLLKDAPREGTAHLDFDPHSMKDLFSDRKHRVGANDPDWQHPRVGPLEIARRSSQ